MAVTLEAVEAVEAGTRVTFRFNDIPPGIRPEDNETGTELTQTLRPTAARGVETLSSTRVIPSSALPSTSVRRQCRPR
ncbi:MAG: hypothetical protein K0Q72_2216 [Armatimonadetes bacterium]|nr:hypothetical protein [Armatimonadota bacterium]